ncbi:MAG: hypothetical protein CL762_00145 [Chloroflexi bacterium]|nr:hypothetical protein [Chloroflexota bacterium]|tara:strand:- start:6549 stop:7064 length:516 start_codon:yes stop_codon:yes gene_type:complete
MKTPDKDKCGCGKEISTFLKCGDKNCENFICPNCMIQTKTVPKCKECAKLKTNPAFNPTPKDLVLSFIVCMFISISFALIFRVIVEVLSNFIPSIIIYYLVILPVPILGWIIGNVIERTSGYKKSLTLVVIAGLSVAIGHLTIWSGFSPDIITWLLSLVIGIYLSIIKVKI